VRKSLSRLNKKLSGPIIDRNRLARLFLLFPHLYLPSGKKGKPFVCQMPRPPQLFIYLHDCMTVRGNRWAIPGFMGSIRIGTVSFLKALDENETVFPIPAVNPCNILCCGQTPSSGGHTHSYFDSPSFLLLLYHGTVSSVPPVSLLCRSRSTKTGPGGVCERGRSSTSRQSVFVEACVSVGAVVLQVAKRLSSRSFFRLE